jgi:proteasome lid subunit RPN8/RPN11
VTRVFRCRNTAPDPRIRYYMEPRDQLAAFHAMDEAGEELLGIYHSHPASEPRPSPTDLAESRYPEAMHVLVSLRSGSVEAAAWRIAHGEVQPVALDIAE